MQYEMLVERLGLKEPEGEEGVSKIAPIWVVHGMEGVGKERTVVWEVRGCNLLVHPCEEIGGRCSGVAYEHVVCM